MHFEIVWRNLIYYHQSVLKQLRDANKKNAKILEVAAKKAKQEEKEGNKKKLSLENGVSGVPLAKLPSHRQSIVPRNGQPRPTLNNISGSFRSGQMTAIMGPSGAG